MRSFDDIGDEDAAVDMAEDRLALRFAGKRTLREYVDTTSRAKKQAAKEAAGAAGSGERDVPRRDRHTLLLQHNARAAAKRRERPAHQEEEHEQRGEREEGGGREHPLYEQVKESKAKAKMEREAKYARAPKGYREEDAVEPGERREAGRVITKNRGLVPHRSKEKKNPRVKHRRKYEKSQIKQRSSFYGKQERTDRGSYGGESTGIKANISRSRAL